VDQASPLRTDTDALTEKQTTTADAARLFGVKTVRLVQTVLLSTNQRSSRRVVFCSQQIAEAQNAIKVEESKPSVRNHPIATQLINVSRMNLPSLRVS
jgi:hypothetical protein